MSASGQNCRSSLLTPDEARDVVKAVPDAIASKKIGGELSVIDWAPGNSYNTEKFYFFELLTTNSLPTTPLGNGVLGYFGVSKVTGQVVELNSQSQEVQGAELRRLQQKLRTKHCVTKELTRRNLDLPLEKE